MAAFILDLDGTLVDSVYQHVFAWHTALHRCGFTLPMWRLHRKIGMSGGLLMDALSVELGRELDEATCKKLETIHAEEFERLVPSIAPLDGVNELLETFRKNSISYAIATTGHRAGAEPLLRMLDLPGDVPVVAKEDASTPKPSPELFLSAAEKLGSSSEETMVVGDSVWDMLAARRAHFLGVGLLCGGYAESEMTDAGAFRVFADPGQLRRHLYETGVTLQGRH